VVAGVFIGLATCRPVMLSLSVSERTREIGSGRPQARHGARGLGSR
jgi:hypothetical protein